MKNEDRDRFLRALASMAELFGRDLSETIIATYWRLGQNLSIEDFEKAATKAMDNLQYFPLPVEIRRLAGVMPTADKAIRAWTEVAKAVKNHGAYKSVDFEDKAINATIRAMGGWERFCQLPEAEFHVWAKKDFERIYASYSDSGTTDEAGEYLLGTHEKNNTGADWGDRLLTTGPVEVGKAPLEKVERKQLRPKTAYMKPHEFPLEGTRNDPAR